MWKRGMPGEITPYLLSEGRLSAAQVPKPCLSYISDSHPWVSMISVCSVVGPVRIYPVPYC